MSWYATQAAVPEQIGEILALIREHGPNPWNFLPEVELRRRAALARVQMRRTVCVLRRDASA